MALKKMLYFPLVPRLQRFYSSLATASHMRWDCDNPREPNILSHPSDGEAWKHFDETYLDFVVDPLNVRLGLCADSFSPYALFGHAILLAYHHYSLQSSSLDVHERRSNVPSHHYSFSIQSQK